VSALGKDIDALYFDYKPAAGHLPDCRLAGMDLWEVTRFTWVNSWDEATSETTIRLACHECGVVHFETSDSPCSAETTHASEVGYASRPEKVLGVWLHPGPRIWHRDERGPTSYLVTASNEPPRHPEDVLGKIGWHLGSRGGVKWGAGQGCTEHGAVLTTAEQYFTSRRAAVAWVVANASGAQ
jgi:hypothetical protein